MTDYKQVVKMVKDIINEDKLIPDFMKEIACEYVPYIVDIDSSAFGYDEMDLTTDGSKKFLTMTAQQAFLQALVKTVKVGVK